MAVTEFATTFALVFFKEEGEWKEHRVSCLFYCIILSLVHKNDQEPWTSVSPKFLDSLSL